ncbi:hypothetical protein HD596_009710 [Nonomuraea jabiensis]|uniref:Uncharacterized protein n=1 Tax=Nonomuraea jabiensis TaxID=882448 RepID=A0A7W9LGH3_9ACTN|nr:hypothetical protein [Nonomuraea jabiensis]
MTTAVQAHSRACPPPGKISAHRLDDGEARA